MLQQKESFGDLLPGDVTQRKVGVARDLPRSGLTDLLTLTFTDFTGLSVSNSLELEETHDKGPGTEREGIVQHFVEVSSGPICTPTTPSSTRLLMALSPGKSSPVSLSDESS